MLVTIITDASHCPDTGACGWAYWVATNRGKKVGSGSEVFGLEASSEAELTAMIRGVVAAYENRLLEPGDWLILQTDCQAAIDAISGKRRKINPMEQQLANNFNALLTSLNLSKMEVRHVPGHTAGATPRTYVNNVCDRMAKHAMRKARNQMKRIIPFMPC